MTSIGTLYFSLKCILKKIIIIKTNVSEVVRANVLEEVPENTGPIGTIPLIYWFDSVFSTISKIPLPLLVFGLNIKGHEPVQLSSGADANFLNLWTFLPDCCSDLLAFESQESTPEYTSVENSIYSICENFCLKSQRLRF